MDNRRISLVCPWMPYKDSSGWHGCYGACCPFYDNESTQVCQRVALEFEKARRPIILSEEVMGSHEPKA